MVELSLYICATGSPYRVIIGNVASNCARSVGVTPASLAVLSGPPLCSVVFWLDLDLDD